MSCRPELRRADSMATSARWRRSRLCLSDPQAGPMDLRRVSTMISRQLLYVQRVLCLASYMVIHCDAQIVLRVSAEMNVLYRGSGVVSHQQRRVHFFGVAIDSVWTSLALGITIPPCFSTLTVVSPPGYWWCTCSPCASSWPSALQHSSCMNLSVKRLMQIPMLFTHDYDSSELLCASPLLIEIWTVWSCRVTCSKSHFAWSRLESEQHRDISFPSWQRAVFVVVVVVVVCLTIPFIMSHLNKHAALRCTDFRAHGDWYCCACFSFVFWADITYDCGRRFELYVCFSIPATQRLWAVDWLSQEWRGAKGSSTPLWEVPRDPGTLRTPGMQSIQSIQHLPQESQEWPIYTLIRCVCPAQVFAETGTAASAGCERFACHCCPERSCRNITHTVFIKFSLSLLFVELCTPSAYQSTFPSRAVSVSIKRASTR